MNVLKPYVEEVRQVRRLVVWTQEDDENMSWTQG